MANRPVASSTMTTRRSTRGRPVAEPAPATTKSKAKKRNVGPQVDGKRLHLLRANEWLSHDCLRVAARHRHPRLESPPGASRQMPSHRQKSAPPPRHRPRNGAGAAPAPARQLRQLQPRRRRPRYQRSERVGARGRASPPRHHQLGHHLPRHHHQRKSSQLQKRRWWRQQQHLPKL